MSTRGPSQVPLDPERVREALREVICPGTRRDVVSIDLIGPIRVEGDRVSVQILHTSERPELIAQVRDLVERRVAALPGVARAEVTVHRDEPAGEAEGHHHGPAAEAPDPWAERRPLPGVRRVVAVASAKGGVGKSSVAVNLALALRESGHRVGLLDADVYGPSVPTMLGITAEPEVTDDRKLVPVPSHGLQVMSIGFWLDPDQPVIWRGPMVFSQVKQFLHDVAWGELDHLVVDLPPGTGDAQLTLIQQVPLSGVVMVTTPQEIALADVRRGIQMFRHLKVQVPVLGVVENMSWFECPDTGKRYPIFGSGGGQAVAAQFDLPLLAQIPIEPAIREGGDTGVPAVARGEGPARDAFLRLAERVASAVA